MRVHGAAVPLIEMTKNVELASKGRRLRTVHAFTTGPIQLYNLTRRYLHRFPPRRLRPQKSTTGGR